MTTNDNTTPATSETTPWIAEPSGDGFYRVVSKDSIVLAQRCVKEDAELFAAAPDFKAAVDALLDVMLDGRSDDFDEKEEEAFRLADQAFTKAYGKES